MKMSHFKKLFAIVSVLVSPMIFAQTSELVEEEPYVMVHRVDNQAGVVVINDVLYKLRLSTRVYGKGKKPLNRYALRVGQKVLIDASRQNHIDYVDTIVIYE